MIYSKSEDLKGHVIAGIAVGDGRWGIRGGSDGFKHSDADITRGTPIFVRLGTRTPPRDGEQTYLRGVMIDNVHATVCGAHEFNRGSAGTDGRGCNDFQRAD